MKIALIGASGFIGKAILDEALNRGHDVLAIVRNPERVKTQPHLLVTRADVLDNEQLAGLFEGMDAVIAAYNGAKGGEVMDTTIKATHSIIRAMKQASVQRLLFVGGAGSLQIPEKEIDLVDTDEFPEAWKEGALATRESLRILRREKDLNWTFLSPSAHIEPGPRTGRFRLGSDELLLDEKGERRISTADYAMAMIDELEKPSHMRSRFTVGY